MTSPVFGRTNLVVPPVWLGLTVPEGGATANTAHRLVEVAIEAHVPLDITSSPAFWGGAMRATDAFLTAVGNLDYERAANDRHATELVQAHLLQTLSAVGRECIDIYYLRVRKAVEEFQIAGALEALEIAKQEGNIRFIGLCSDGPALATLGMWQFHDAFEVLVLPRSLSDDESFRTLSPMARDRRVGLVTSKPFEPGTPSGEALKIVGELTRSHPVLVPVRTADEAVAILSRSMAA